jgi:hypothetical protein
MNPDESSTPWLEADEWEGDNGLLGNRRGLEVLREAIAQALTHPDDAIPVLADRGSIWIVKLCDPPPLPAQRRLRDKIVGGMIIAIFLSILLFALFGLSQLIKLLSS